MIISQLRTVLANHRMNITSLSRATGIPRATITLLADNKNVGVQFATLDKICMALHTDPASLFLYAPISVDAHVKPFANPDYDTSEPFSFRAPFKFSLFHDGKLDERDMAVDIDFVPSDKNFVIYLPKEMADFLKPLQSLPVLFRATVLDKFFDKIASELDKPTGYTIIQIFGDGIL